jgi:acyl dehydratase
MASDGELYNEDYNTTLIPGLKLSRAYGATAPEHSLHESVRTSTPLTIQRFAMDEDQTRRYSEASRDYSAYTMRLGAAREMGFDGLLVHGLLTLSFACRAIVQHACAEDSTLLRRLACRFTAPVILTAGQSVTTKIWKLTKKSDREAVGFESTDTSGAVVVGHGRAELQS